MKKSAKVGLVLLTLISGATLLSSCTASFCSVKDRAEMLYAFDYGVTNYYASTDENLPIDAKYTIKEVETAKDYILSEKPITIELEENEIKTITFKNKKIEQDKKETLPRTGQIDASNYLLGISIAGTIINTQILRKKNTKNKKDNNK